MIKTCSYCNTTWEFDSSDFVYLEPYPHYECPKCRMFIPAF